MTQDNPDKPQPEKAKSKVASKSKATHATPGVPVDDTPAATVKPRARKAAAPKATEPEVAAPGTTSPKTTSPKTTSPKTTASRTATPKASVPGATATKTTATKTSAPKTTASRTTAKPVTSKPGVSEQAAKTGSTAPAKSAKSSTAKTAVARPKAAVKPEVDNQEVPALPRSLDTAQQTAIEVPVEPLSAGREAVESPVFVEPPLIQNTLPPRADKASPPKSVWQRAAAYWRLMRMHKPIGTLLLLWPTLWALWLAAKGMPRLDLLIIFVLGVFVMRSAGCVINDYADRKIDGRVKRTKDRPLVNGEVSSGEAIGLFFVLCLVAFGLVLLTNKLTIQLSVGGLLLAFCYPFMKRYTHLPQVVLGAAFAWSIPMAFAAQSGDLVAEVWLVYTTVVLWTVVYDTFYAMVDRDDDRRIGVKSTAILFGEQDRIITGVLQALTIYGLAMIGSRFELGVYYYVSLVVAALLFAYQQYLIRLRERDACFKAFLNNNWVGAAIFTGILLDFLLRTPL